MEIKSRQQENSEQTRSALREAAQELFINQNYCNVSVDEISRHARVTKGAFYHHFSNKKALLKECYLFQVDKVVEKLVQIPTYDDQWQELEVIFSVCVDHIYQHKDKLIPLQEIISVLGWKEWDEIDSQILIPRIRKCVDVLYDQQEICIYSSDIVVNLIYGFVTHITINLKNEVTLSENACKDFKMIFSDFLMGIKQSSINAKNHK